MPSATAALTRTARSNHNQCPQTRTKTSTGAKPSNTAGHKNGGSVGDSDGVRAQLLSAATAPRSRPPARGHRLRRRPLPVQAVPSASDRRFSTAAPPPDGSGCRGRPPADARPRVGVRLQREWSPGQGPRTPRPTSPCRALRDHAEPCITPAKTPLPHPNLLAALGPSAPRRC